MASGGYPTLKGEECTRLLELCPADNQTTPIQCDLVNVSMDDVPGYEALSYAWGSPVRDQPIQCRSQGHAWTIYITKHLLSALYQLRSDKGYRRLWIDQLCINQDDLEERRLQVSQMDKIYRKAARTVIWLGEETVDTPLGLSLSVSLCSAADTWLPHTSYFEDDTPSVENGFSYYYSLPVSTSGAWAALDAILDRSWFTRYVCPCSTVATYAAYCP